MHFNASSLQGVPVCSHTLALAVTCTKLLSTVRDLYERELSHVALPWLRPCKCEDAPAVEAWLRDIQLVPLVAGPKMLTLRMRRVVQQRTMHTIPYHRVGALLQRLARHCPNLNTLHLDCRMRKIHREYEGEEEDEKEDADGDTHIVSAPMQKVKNVYMYNLSDGIINIDKAFPAARVIRLWDTRAAQLSFVARDLLSGHESLVLLSIHVVPSHREVDLADVCALNSFWSSVGQSDAAIQLSKRCPRLNILRLTISDVFKDSVFFRSSQQHRSERRFQVIVDFRSSSDR